MERGVSNADELESEHVDLKEEAGRRDKDGTILPSSETNEVAAKALAEQSTCMANTPGGGVLIVGVADNTGELIGTSLNTWWLRNRIYQLTSGKITPDVQEVQVNGVRLLVITIIEAISPVEWNRRYSWCVGTSCVPMTLDEWQHNRRKQENYDWSSLDSGISLDQVRHAAVEAARDILLDTGEPNTQELAEAPTPDFLRRLGVVTANNTLTNAGALLFTARRTPAALSVRSHQRTSSRIRPPHDTPR